MIKAVENSRFVSNFKKIDLQRFEAAQTENDDVFQDLYQYRPLIVYNCATISNVRKDLSTYLKEIFGINTTTPSLIRVKGLSFLFL